MSQCPSEAKGNPCVFGRRPVRHQVVILLIIMTTWTTIEIFPNQRAIRRDLVVLKPDRRSAGKTS